MRTSRAGLEGSARRRSAFTLLELMLVLAIIVALAALAAPSFKSVLDSQRLKRGGDHLRAQLAKAKNRSMRSGRVYVFRYQPGGEAFYMQPWYSDEDILEASDASDLAAGGMSGPVASVPLAPAGNTPPAGTGGAFVDPFSVPDYLEKLPEGVAFVGGESIAEARDMTVEQDIAMAGGLTSGWSRPILFYPDGSSSSAQVVLQNKRNEILTVSLRGLTGIASVSDVTPMGDLPP